MPPAPGPATAARTSSRDSSVFRMTIRRTTLTKEVYTELAPRTVRPNFEKDARPVRGPYGAGAARGGRWRRCRSPRPWPRRRGGGAPGGGGARPPPRRGRPPRGPEGPPARQLAALPPADLLARVLLEPAVAAHRE